MKFCNCNRNYSIYSILAAALLIAGFVRADYALSEHVSMRGTVTFAQGGRNFAFFLTDKGEKVRLGLLGGNPVHPGEYVEIEGDVSMVAPNIRLENVEVKKRGEGKMPVRELVKVADLQDPSYNRFGLPVELTVRVLDVNRRRTQLQLYVCDLDAKAAGATASFPMREHEIEDENLKRGAIIRVKACPSMIYEPDGVKNLTLNILWAGDVEVLTRPPWWTPFRVAVAGCFGLSVCAMLLVWIALLKRAERAERLSKDERLRLARGLHDEFQQQLAGTMFLLDAAASVSDDPEAVALQIANAQKSLAFTQSGLRSILWGLQKAGHEADTLSGALRTASLRMPHWQGVVEIEDGGEPPGVILQQRVRLLMIMQEAVGNAIKHGGAKHVKVRTADDGRVFTMTVADDGCGFDTSVPVDSSRHMGLSNMRLRAEAMEGTLRVESEPGKGTTVKVDVRHD